MSFVISISIFGLIKLIGSEETNHMAAKGNHVGPRSIYLDMQATTPVDPRVLGK